MNYVFMKFLYTKRIQINKTYNYKTKSTDLV